MSEKPVPAGKWKLRPHDHKCKTFVDPDPLVEDQIRCRVPLWTGDFDEVIPELIAQGCRIDELPKLTVYAIGQFAIRASQGGSLRCGTVGTASHAIVGRLPWNEIAEGDDWHARVARGLESTPRRVLWYMRENNARGAADKVTRQRIADDLRVSIDDVQAAGEAFRRLEKPLIESTTGRAGGWWLSPDGDRVAEHCAPPVARVATATQSRKAK